jgi:hypothetical protein
MLSKQEFTHGGIEAIALAYSPLRHSIAEAKEFCRTPAQQSEKIADSNHLGIAPVPLGLVGIEVPITQGGGRNRTCGIGLQDQRSTTEQVLVSDIGLEPTIFWERQTLCH